MKVLRTLHPLGWFLGSTALLWTLVLLVPLVHHGTWYAGYPFFISERSYSDLLVFIPQFQHFHQPDFYTVSDFPLVYPAFGCLVIGGLLAAGHGMAVFCAIILLAVLAGLVSTSLSFMRHGLPPAASFGLMFALALTSFPLYFDLLRGNIEFFSCLCLAIGFALCWHKRWSAGAVFFGLAIALKLYPVIVLGFLVAQRKYRATMVALVSAALANFGSLAILGPSVAVAQHYISQGLAYMNRMGVVVLARGAATFDHSLFGVYKLLAFHATHQADFQQAARTYLLVAVLLAVVLYLWRIVRLPAINQVVVLTALAVLLPPVSYDYTLLALYIPWVLLASYSLRLPAAAHPQRRVLIVSFLCLAWLLCPETYLRSVTGLTKCIALLVLVAVQCRTPLQAIGPPQIAGKREDLPNLRNAPAR